MRIRVHPLVGLTAGSPCRRAADAGAECPHPRRPLGSNVRHSAVPALVATVRRRSRRPACDALGRCAIDSDSLVCHVLHDSTCVDSLAPDSDQSLRVSGQAGADPISGPGSVFARLRGPRAHARRARLTIASDPGERHTSLCVLFMRPAAIKCAISLAHRRRGHPTRAGSRLSVDPPLSAGVLEAYAPKAVVVKVI